MSCFCCCLVAKLCLMLYDPMDWSPEGDQSWVFIGGTVAEAETSILWPSDAKSWLIGKDFDAGRDWRQEEKGMTGWDGWMASPTWWTWVWVNSRSWWWTTCQGGLVCWNSWGCKKSDMTEWLNWTELNQYLTPFYFIILMESRDIL